jgi:hypothetical protein
MSIAGIIDYIGVGPIFATKTKKDVCEPVGLEYLDYVVENIRLPFVAIGGIKEHNIGLVRSRGAKIICLVTEIVGAENILRDAFFTDVRPVLADWRKAHKLDADPLAAYRASGYEVKVAKEREEERRARGVVATSSYA